MSDFGITMKSLGDTALRTYIKNLRKIVGKDTIESIKKQGYKFIITK